MIILMGKYKMQEWKEIDRADNKDDMDYLENEYKNELGSGWMFKRIEKQE